METNKKTNEKIKDTLKKLAIIGLASACLVATSYGIYHVYNDDVQAQTISSEEDSVESQENESNQHKGIGEWSDIKQVEDKLKEAGYNVNLASTVFVSGNYEYFITKDMKIAIVGVDKDDKLYVNETFNYINMYYKNIYRKARITLPENQHCTSLFARIVDNESLDIICFASNFSGKNFNLYHTTIDLDKCHIFLESALNYVNDSNEMFSLKMVGGRSTYKPALIREEYFSKTETLL